MTFVRISILLVFGWAIAIAQSTPVSIADIPGDGSSHQLTASATTARWITFCALKSNATTLRVGDSAITTSRGIPLDPGSCFAMLESTGVSRQQLSFWYYLIQSGDKLSVTYGQ